MAAPTQGTPFTRPETFGASAKRPRKVNLYAQLLPLTNSPPVSILNACLSALRPAVPGQESIEAIYDKLTQSVWVSGEKDMINLWRRGFFGKGALSRSEPAFRRRVENAIAELAGGEKQLTSEEITAARRITRHASKLVKKAERESEKLIAASAAVSQYASSSTGSPPSTTIPLPSTSALPFQPTLEASPSEQTLQQGLAQILEEADALPTPTEEPIAIEVVSEEPPPLWHLTAEHTQLQPEETFFLIFALGCLNLRSSDPFAPLPTIPSSNLSILATWKLFLLDSSALLHPLPQPTAGLSTTDDPRLNRFDSPFLLQYAAYHHFRSMGWVVRSGIKFCADWVLYGSGGPVGGHAEFAVVVLPTYADIEDAKTSPFRTQAHSALNDQGDGILAEGERKLSWRWFNTVNRVCSGVKKTLVLCYIIVPPMASLPSRDWIAQHPAEALARLQIREVTVRRWIAGRSRD